jgi:CheY-like chemotaxis protein
MTVLVVDDEPAVRRLVHRALRESGVEVLEASDGEAALQLIQDIELPLDLVVTDIAMPRIDGRVLAEVLSVFRPEVPVLAMSGHPANAGNTRSDRRVPLLQKPFTVPELRAAMDSAGSRPRQARRQSGEHRAMARRLQAAAREASGRAEARRSQSVDLVAMAHVLQRARDEHPDSHAAPGAPGI